jgi:hypothetical protein
VIFAQGKTVFAQVNAIISYAKVLFTSVFAIKVQINVNSRVMNTWITHDCNINSAKNIKSNHLSADSSSKCEFLPCCVSVV